MKTLARLSALYIKPRPGGSNIEGYPHNYDPRGWNKFEDDALALRRFWDSLIDYPNLWFDGRIESGPGKHRYCLLSEKEVVAYCSSATGEQNVKYEPQILTLHGLALKDGNYSAEVIVPAVGVVENLTVSVKAGSVNLNLPAFTDDIAVHIH